MLNPAEEVKFAELKAMCRDLHVPAPPEIMIGLRVHDKNGILTFDDVQRGHSWTRNFYNFLLGIVSTGRGGNSNNFGAGYMSGKVSGGTVYYDSANTCGHYAAGNSFALVGTDIGYNKLAAGITQGGILVGTGDTAFNADQYAMATLVAHGNGAGQLFYQAMAGATPSYTAGTKTWKETLTRIINNNSGGSITVKEAGLGYYGNLYFSAVNASTYYLMERSVLSPTVAVANGAQLTVTYEISMDFSAID